MKHSAVLTTEDLAGLLEEAHLYREPERDHDLAAECPQRLAFLQVQEGLLQVVALPVVDELQTRVLQ